MKIPLNPLPSALLESLRSIGYNIETALADLVDNSITAEAERISVRYLWNNGKPWIAVCDDGLGMNKKELIEAMRLGSKNPKETRKSHDLGRFGLGLKTASFSQCRQLVVISLKEGDLIGCKWDLDDVEDENSLNWEATLLKKDDISCDKELSFLLNKYLKNQKTGTIVLWRKLDSELGDPMSPAGEARFSSNMDFAKKHLELVFHRFLSNTLKRKRLFINFNDTMLVPFDPFGTPVPARQELPQEKIVIDGKSIIVQPYVLPHFTKAASVTDYQRLAGEEGYLQNQGFYVYRNHRLIIKATWFRLISKDELNKLIRIRVDIPNSLDHLWRIDIKKSQASPPEPVRRELKRIIQRIAGSGRIVFTNRATRIQNRKIVPVWNREIIDGRIRYAINEDHPMIMGLYKLISNSTADCLRAWFELVNSTFPYDMYYADAANDKTEFHTLEPDSNTIKNVGTQLVRALKECGFHQDEICDKIRTSEFFLCDEHLLIEILQKEFK